LKTNIGKVVYLRQY